jgi:hypothetical protein
MTVKPTELLPFSRLYGGLQLGPSNIYLYDLRSYCDPSQLVRLDRRACPFQPVSDYRSVTFLLIIFPRLSLARPRSKLWLVH